MENIEHYTIHGISDSTLEKVNACLFLHFDDISVTKEPERDYELLKVSPNIRQNDFELMIHGAIIDELVWQEKQGIPMNAHATSKNIRELIGNKFYSTVGNRPHRGD